MSGCKPQRIAYINGSLDLLDIRSRPVYTYIVSLIAALRRRPRILRRPREPRRAVTTALAATCIALVLLFALRRVGAPSGYVSPQSCAHPPKCALPAWIAPSILTARAIPALTHDGTDFILTIRLQITRSKFYPGGDLEVVSATGRAISPIVDSSIPLGPSGVPAARTCSQLPPPSEERLLPGGSYGSFPRLAPGTYEPVTDCFAIGTFPVTAIKVIWAESLIVAGSSPPQNVPAPYYSGPSFEGFSRILTIPPVLGSRKS